MQKRNMENKKRVLLTGVGGSIACHFLAHIFTNTDWEIVGIDSFRHKGWTDRVRVMLDSHPDWKERLNVITQDLTVPISPIMRSEIGHIDYIINMASLSDVEASIKNPVTFVKNNVDLALSVLEYAKDVWGLNEKNQIPPSGTAFIQISTDEVYGASASKFGDLRKEWDPIIPSNPYAASKACQEAIAISYWRTYGVPLILTNTMNNFGEYQQPSKYPVMIQKAVMKGEEITIHGRDGHIGSRSYIHSRNFADAILFLLKNCPPHLHVANTADRPDRYNIAGERQLDNLELAQLIAKLMGKELKYRLIDSHTARPGHDPHYGLDSTKLYSLGWKAPIDFETSLKNTIDYQMENIKWIELQ